MMRCNPRETEKIHTLVDLLQEENYHTIQDGLDSKGLRKGPAWFPASRKREKKDLCMNDFITIDFETGLYERNSAVSIGLAKYHNYQQVDSFYSLIKPPKMHIRPDFTRIHGITLEDVQDAPDFKQLWEHDILHFLEGMPLAAHNAPFDMSVLKAVLEWHKVPVPALSYFCTCTLARHTWPGMESYSLPALAKVFGIIYRAHNAMEDALACGTLVDLSAEEFRKRKSLTKLLAAAGVRMNVLSSIPQATSEKGNR